jgi:hypothetical protein
MLAGALLASAPSISVEHALRLAIKILEVCKEMEQLKQLAVLWEFVHECHSVR